MHAFALEHMMVFSGGFFCLHLSSSIFLTFGSLVHPLIFLV